MSSGSGVSDATREESEIRGSCFCKTVSYAFTGKPVMSAYCHCTNCQRLTNCPFVHTIHLPASSFRWTHTASDGSPVAMLDAYTIPSKPHKTRYRCRTCGACVANYNSKRDRFSVWGAQLERREGTGRGGKVRIKTEVWDVVRPTAHIFYETRMLDVRDGLGKWAGYEGMSARVPETEAGDDEDEDEDEAGASTR